MHLPNVGHKNTTYILFLISFYYLGLSNVHAFGLINTNLIGRQSFVATSTSSIGDRSKSRITEPTSSSKYSIIMKQASNSSNNKNGEKGEEEKEDERSSVSGSFFNQVPSSPKNGDNVQNQDVTSATPSASTSTDADGNSSDPFEASMLELMRSRNKKPLASEPSTIGGVPTSQAKGFGKQSTPKGPQIINTTQSSSSSSKSFVGIGKPLNDINKPEYDDQGYTLYANEETGEKKRVFEALIEYPCEFKMKIIGANEGTFASEMVQVVADSCNVESSTVKYSERTNGKWTSVTVYAPVESAEMLYALYENIDRDPRVKFKF